MEIPARIEVGEGGATVAVTWEDGRHDRFTATQLRAACQCAGCREDDGRATIERLVAGERPITITAARLVGNYALAFDFSPDGHSAGIYPYGVLRSLGETSID